MRGRSKYLVGLILVFQTIAFATEPKLSLNQDNKDFYIEIHDNQYGCYGSREYYLQDSTLHIDDYDEEGDNYTPNYKARDLLSRKLSAIEIEREKSFLSHFCWDSLRTDYASGRDGCDSIRQIAVTIRWNNSSKQIQIQDCYSEKVAKIFKFINSIIPKSNREELGISYKAKDFKCRK